MAKPLELIRVEFQEYLWRALQVFNMYRLLLSLTFLLLLQTGIAPKGVGSGYPELYTWIISLYFFLSIVIIGLLIIRKPGYKSSVILQLTLDIMVVVGLMYATGGINNGVGVLLAVSVGVSSLLIGNRKSLAVPAAATLALFAQAAVANYLDNTPIEFTSIAFLGGSFFVISFLSLTLAKRLHYSEMAAIESQADLATMQAVNLDIIQTLSSGVILLNDSLGIQMINDAAWRYLGKPSQPTSKPLKTVCREIYLATKQWLANPRTDSALVPVERIRSEFQVSFRNLGAEQHNLILLFLEDTSKLTQQAQQLKLSSLGRLTASIAHEIRNPLGAISHAAQLLNESDNMTDAEKNICEVIIRHSKRMNNIIENVLNLSQHRPPQQEEVQLASLIEQIKHDLVVHHKPTPEIEVRLQPETVSIYFDRSQLTQIISNLCENGLRYSYENTGIAKIQLVVGQEYPSSQVYLDIIDQGPGVPEDQRETIFEPFFTTSSKGTGLGLYLARELCESNGARLNYLPLAGVQGACFRIRFPA